VVSLNSEKMIVLASRSESRKKALKLLGLKFRTIPSKIDESAFKEKRPELRAKGLAELKASSVAKKLKNAVVIGADLIVVYRNKIYEKPKSKSEALAMLKSFSGKTVTVVAGLAVVDSSSGKMLSTVEKCKVKFRKLTDNEIKEYIAKYPVLKFSAAFDGNAALMFAERVEGSIAFYTGIPLNELVLFLRKLRCLK